MFNQKILCLGTNDSSTDLEVSKLAHTYHTINHGLLDTIDRDIEYGYYHTSVTDLNSGQIVKLSEKFDKIRLLDQPKEAWSHWKVLLTSFKVCKELDKRGYKIEYRYNKNIKSFNTFYKLTHEENQSFCIYPFVLLTEDQGHVTTCARSDSKIANSIQEVGNYKTNPKFRQIREKMLRGEKVLPHCNTCYNYEKKGIESSRQFETLEWASKLNLESLEDLKKLDNPSYYEIRLSNKCNLMCRSCRPEHSHLIEKEYKIHNIEHPRPLPFKFSNFSHVDIKSLNNKSRIYLTGGEPTVMQDFYDFCEQCIALDHTDFDFTIGTNAQTFTPKFWKTINQFTNMNFSVSVDGFGKYNDYQRWKSDFDTVMSNSKKLEEQGHNVTFLIVPGIFNVTNLHLLFEYLDKHFPKTALYVQINHNELQSAFNHPRPDLVIESMKKCQQTKIYHSDGRSCKTTIDSILSYYSNNPQLNLNILKRFFEYNDKIDQARGVQLKDYIPELDEGRKLFNG
jgi:MoaA/NifB/PqqE/SkfB family radical SAM enzyme